MKIIILGAGQVGSSVAENLVSEANDITVVDTDPALLQAMQNKHDLRAVVGNAASPAPPAQERVAVQPAPAATTSPEPIIDPEVQGTMEF